MAPKRRPSADDARAAVTLLLGAVDTGVDILDAMDRIRPLHPKNDTFPGEVFMRVAAEALSLGGVGADRPMSDDGLIGRYVPEARFRGRDNRKMRFAVIAVAATHGGVEVDLLDEVASWQSDDFWSYAALAAVVWIRAVSDRRDIPLSRLCQQLCDRHSDKMGA